VDGRHRIEPDVGHLPPLENPDVGAIVLVNDVGCSITVLFGEPTLENIRRLNHVVIHTDHDHVFDFHFSILS
jgi:hypothetical protein